jgi:hypothetical protein
VIFVILSAVETSRSEVPTQSKDPTQCQADRIHRAFADPAFQRTVLTPPQIVIPRKRSPSRSGGLPTKDLCTPSTAPMPPANP